MTSKELVASALAGGTDSGSSGIVAADVRACCPSALFPRANWLVVIAAIVGIANPRAV
jgi:hypothetical protein